MEKSFDITVFGATGFTGKFILLEVLKTAKSAFPGQKLRVGVAGRSLERLEQLVNSLPSSSNFPDITLTIIIADVKDEGSMRGMCRDSKTLIAAGMATPKSIVSDLRQLRGAMNQDFKTY